MKLCVSMCRTVRYTHAVIYRCLCTGARNCRQASTHIYTIPALDTDVGQQDVYFITSRISCQIL